MYGNVREKVQVCVHSNEYHVNIYMDSNLMLNVKCQGSRLEEETSKIKSKNDDIVVVIIPIMYFILWYWVHIICNQYHLKTGNVKS